MAGDREAVSSIATSIETAWLFYSRGLILMGWTPEEVALSRDDFYAGAGASFILLLESEDKAAIVHTMQQEILAYFREVGDRPRKKRRAEAVH